MALTPLTRVQQATVIALVETRRLEVVPADQSRASAFVRQAAERLDRLRRARNQDRYQARPVGATDAAKAEQVSRALLDAALAQGLPS